MSVCLQCILSMFEDMGFINTYKIDLHTLARSDSSICANIACLSVMFCSAPP